jgi:DNA-binding HxlR family transcriptional regulator
MKAGTSEDQGREDCAPRRVLELFSAKWISMVLHTLGTRHAGSARSNALHRSLPGISRKVLTQTLRDLEHAGALTRSETDTVPPMVEYTLTPLGVTLLEPIELIYAWARRNSPALDALEARPTSRRRN